ncbi:MAG: phosphatidylglycerol lysyltransferase domain-containing protein [Candidatus Pacebacteria bacterium]|nr:phosphatidylglycerol lysyltransferase domain-containing protein [Candidatus Paceibacterota bacterium]MCF7857086.1 phosphatidylglycerol lysyltransferase domain-containing protein [Candidatus Paceibacterota bacterium]
MIPKFPKFKSISVEDSNEIRRFSNRFQPYSFFNFSSLWAWNTEKKCKISKLNGNLVMFYTDFITSKPFVTFLGTNKAKETAAELIEFIKKSKTGAALRFITEETKTCLLHSDFHIKEDRDNFDYIFSTSKLALSEGPDFKQKRQHANRFLRENPDARLVHEDMHDLAVRKKLTGVIRQWEKNKIDTKKQCNLKHEQAAINRLLKNDTNRKLILSCVYVDETMVGFSIDEILLSGYAMAHFIKADYSYRGVSEYINEKVAAHLITHGIELWNWQQDLNFDGLRKLKMSYRPVHFLKTYTISKK